MPIVQFVVRFAIAVGAMFYTMYHAGPPNTKSSKTAQKKWLQKKKDE
ncbi:MAG: hypothetical protein WC878_07055 [Candidatus Paceibacterota bacterium]|jgi:hypothetical protein